MISFHQRRFTETQLIVLTSGAENFFILTWCVCCVSLTLANKPWSLIPSNVFFLSLAAKHTDCVPEGEEGVCVCFAHGETLPRLEPPHPHHAHLTRLTRRQQRAASVQRQAGHLPAATKTEQISQNERKQTTVFETVMKAAAINVGNTTN